jgi:hypothetical protein
LAGYYLYGKVIDGVLFCGLPEMEGEAELCILTGVELHSEAVSVEDFVVIIEDMEEIFCECTYELTFLV